MEETPHSLITLTQFEKQNKTKGHHFGNKSFNSCQQQNSLN